MDKKLEKLLENHCSQRLQKLFKNQKFDNKETFKITSVRELSKEEKAALDKLVKDNLAKNVNIKSNPKLNGYLIKFEVASVDMQKVKEKLSFIDFSLQKVKDN